jgi:tetratricopeptide (TPR) repeat protein
MKRIRGNKQAISFFNQGVALGNLGRLEEAITSYDKAVEIKPDYYDAWNSRGNALAHLGRFSDAIRSYDRALSIEPHNSITLWNKILVLELIWDTRLAAETVDGIKGRFARLMMPS